MSPPAVLPTVNAAQAIMSRRLSAGPLARDASGGRRSYKSMRKREKTSKLFAETIHEHHATLSDIQEGNPQEAAAKSRVVTESNEGANGNQSTDDVVRPRSHHLRNMADDGDMSDSIRAIEQRLVRSAQQHNTARAASLRISGESELARRLRQREQKRQELIEKFGENWADQNLLAHWEQ